MTSKGQSINAALNPVGRLSGFLLQIGPAALRSRIRCLELTLALGMLAHAAVADETSISSAILRTNLMLYRGQNGELERVQRKSDWARRRQEVLQSMQTIMGPLPQKRCALELKIETETEEGSFIRQSVTYSSEPGSRVPAWLLVPKRALKRHERLAGILALHPTDLEYGNRVVVENLRSQYPAYARELAERGFVVLAPAYPLMDNYRPELKVLGYVSGTMKAIWDNMRGLDVLESLPYVRPHTFGAVGHSLGAHNAIFTAVFDTRIKCVVTSCGFDSFQDYMHGDISGWASERYMPRLRQFSARVSDIPFDFPELIGALAPRTVFISAPLHDSNFNWRSVDAVVEEAAAVYQLYGVRVNLILQHPDCAHEFPLEIREEAYRVLERTLR